MAAAIRQAAIRTGQTEDRVTAELIEDRQEYLSQINTLRGLEYTTCLFGHHIKWRSEFASRIRRQLRIVHESALHEEIREIIFERNRELYEKRDLGDQFGPVFELLLASGRTYERILKGALQPDGGDLTR